MSVKALAMALCRVAKAKGLLGIVATALRIPLAPREVSLPSFPDVVIRVQRGRRKHLKLLPSIGEYPVYDELAYFVMTTDRVRNKALAQALARHAPGRRVLDIGTGRDLNWAGYAARRGATSVLAVEGQPDSLASARAKLAKLPGRERITLVGGWSTDLSAEDAKADVCVSEIIGNIAGSEAAAAVLADARARLTRPDAVMVPARAVTLAGAVCVRDLVPDLSFSAFAVHYLDEIFRAKGSAFDVRICLELVGPHHLLSTSEIVEDLDFVAGAAVEGREVATLTMVRPGRVDGLLLWIRLWGHPDDEPVDSLTQSTSWTPVYLPVWDEPVAVDTGDVMRVEFSRTPSGDGVHPDYAAAVRLTTSAGVVEATVRSTFEPTAFRANWFYREAFLRPGQPVPSGSRKVARSLSRREKLAPKVIAFLQCGAHGVFCP